MKVLIVEGNQDKGFIEYLFKRRKIETKISYGDFDIKEIGGFEKIIKRIPAYFQTENYNVIGFIVDADDKLLNHWEQICELLKKQGYKNLPKQPNPKGTIIENDDLPKVGVWLMPDNQADGKLETFIKFLIPEPKQDELLKLAEKTVNGIITKGWNKFTEADKIKVVIHTWLAWQEEPGLSLGQAINYRFKKEQSYILDDKKASDFINWLQKLFKD